MSDYDERDDEEITEDGQPGPAQASSPDDDAPPVPEPPPDHARWGPRPALAARPLEPTWTDDPAEVAPLGYLFVRRPAVEFGTYFLIHEDATIGRGTAHFICLNDPRVSEHHGRVKRVAHPESGSAFALYDFGTSNGTRVNGQPVFGAVILHENDVIEIGGFTFVFKMLTR